MLLSVIAVVPPLLAEFTPPNPPLPDLPNRAVLRAVQRRRSRIFEGGRKLNVGHLAEAGCGDR